jgi:hypothetical protein
MNSTSNAQFWCYMPNRNDTRNLLPLNVCRYLVQMPKHSSVALKALLRLHDFKVSARTHYSHFTWVLVVRNLEPEQVQACLNFASLNCFCTYQRRPDNTILSILGRPVFHQFSTARPLLLHKLPQYLKVAWLMTSK